MKIRNGFVSNSSSSSYTVLLTREDFKKIEDSLSILDAAVVRSIGTEKEDFLGHDCVSFSYVDGNYSTLSYVDNSEIIAHMEKIAKERGEELEDYSEDNIREDAWSSLNTFYNEACKLPRDRRFTHEEDF